MILTVCPVAKECPLGHSDERRCPICQFAELYRQNLRADQINNRLQTAVLLSELAKMRAEKSQELQAKRRKESA